MPPANFGIVYPGQTAASTTAQQMPFPSDQYDSITVGADQLADGETVQLRVVVNGTPKQVTDIYGTAINLTSTVSAVALEGGPLYAFIKDATASACAVIVSPKQKG